MVETFSLERTREALDAYVKADEARSKAWQRAETGPQKLACQKADQDAWAQLRRIFHEDTKTIYSAHECGTATFETMLQAAYPTTSTIEAAQAVAARSAAKDESHKWISNGKLKWIVIIGTFAAFFIYRMMRLNG